MKAHRVATLILVLAASLAFARKDESIEALKQRAVTAPLQELPSLGAEIAERQLKQVDGLYSAGKTEEARAALSDVVTYAGKASDAAGKTGKKLKDTEISLRKMAAKLRDIKRTLEFEEQAPVQDAADQLEQLRTQLLSKMFEKKPKK